MTPPGQNYPIQEHGFLFWGLYLGIFVMVTIALLGLFLLMVHRSSQSVRVQPTTTPPADPGLSAAGVATETADLTAPPANPTPTTVSAPEKKPAPAAPVAAGHA